MLTILNKIKNSIDWSILIPAVLVSLSGIVTMNSFVGNNNFAERQVIWLLISVFVFIIASLVDWRFLRRTKVIVSIFVFSSLILSFLFVVGSVFKGAKSWFNLGFFAFQPVDFAKMVIIFVLAKYFSRRHIEIRNVRHILVSGAYAFITFALIFLQPDFGSAIIIFFIWLGMVLFSGISRKHLFVVFMIGVVSFVGLWTLVFKDYQKARIVSFINPLTDLQGAGYNAYQSTIAVGSGGVWGKGVGLGSQSKLEFLPEYETDFIFAAFAEEWGLIGSVTIFILYGIIFYRILDISKKASTNFETLFGLGFSTILLSHFIIHVGMNIGIMPVTGITLPFMSYGGSHLLAEFFGLGIISAMRNYAMATHKDMMKNELIEVS